MWGAVGMTPIPRQLVLSPEDTARMLLSIAGLGTAGARVTYSRITSLWDSPVRQFVTFTSTEEDRAILALIPLPARVIQSPRYEATYRSDRKGLEVRTWTHARPSKHRTLRTAGGDVRFTLISIHRMTTKESIEHMAKASSKATTIEDELEAELEGLEELEEVEVEEPDDDEEGEDDNNYEASTQAQLKALAKERGIVGISKASKAKLIEMLEAADAEVEDDEEEDDPLAEMDRAALKARLKELDPDASVKKSEEDDDLRDRIRALDEDDDEEEDPTDEEDEDEEDDEEADDEEEDDEDATEDLVDFDGMSRTELKAYNRDNEVGITVRKSMSDEDLASALDAAVNLGAGDDDEEDDGPPPKTKTKGAPKKGSNLPTRELPKGKLSAGDVAEMGGTDARSVRMFLRTEAGQAFPKDAALGRYSFTTVQAKAINKAMKARPPRTGNAENLAKGRATAAANRAAKKEAEAKAARIAAKKAKGAAPAKRKGR